jgi:acetoin utilization protein AcuB
MLITNLISKNIPQLSITDKVSRAIALMDDFELSHLCIIQKDKFIGIVHKEDLLSVDENDIIEVLQDDFTFQLVLDKEHFSKALSIIAEKNLSLIPVLNTDKDFVGVILATNLLHQLSYYIGADTSGGIIIIEMEMRNFSISEITRLVETHDALITQLNTQVNKETGIMTVTIKLNKNEIADILATLQRFEFNIVAYYGEEAYANELQENYSHLMHYLNL